jgi:hypothetical protein
VTTGSMESTGPGIRGGLRDALREAPEPMTAAQLRTKLVGYKKPAVGLVQESLEQMVEDGEIYRWEPARGKADRYWTQDLDIPAPISS